MNFPTTLPLTRSRAHCAALASAAAIMLVPANLLPVLRTDISGLVRTDTIFSGIEGLCDDGNWGIGAIVFIASIMIPALKLLGLGWLLWATRRRPAPHAARLARLYAVLDFIGRWSMLDVFLAGFLAGTVRFGALASIEPRAGIVAFAAAVVLTVLATAAFDPRLLWAPPAGRLSAA
jgi:paraquat-inducible protein A